MWLWLRKERRRGESHQDLVSSFKTGFQLGEMGVLGGMVQRRDVSELTFSRIADGGEEKGL